MNGHQLRDVRAAGAARGRQVAPALRTWAAEDFRHQNVEQRLEVLFKNRSRIYTFIP